MNESSKANDHGTPEQPAGAAPDSVEPKITEPELGAAEISEDVAETVDLKAAEAEAAAVAHEAKLATQGVSSDVGMPDAEAAATWWPEAAPVKKEAMGAAAEKAVQSLDAGAPAGTPGTATSSTAPEPSTTPDSPTPDTATPEEEAPGKESAVAPSVEGQSASDTAPEGRSAPKEPGHIGPGIADGHGWRRPETTWEQSSTPWKPKGESWLSPSQISRKAEDAAAAAAEAAAVSGTPAEVPTSAKAPVAAAAAPAPLPASAAAAAPVSASVAKTPDSPPTSGGSTQTDSNPRKILIIAGIVLVGVALLVAFIILLVGLFRGDGSNGTAPASSDSSLAQQSLVSGPGNATAGADSDLIVAKVSPLNWLEGDCLRDFKDASTPADVVFCSSPHAAQLVGTFYYADSGEYPGLEALKAKAVEVCADVQLTTEAADVKTLRQMTAYPTEATWSQADDRRVDCLVHDTRDGNPLESSLID